MRLARVLMGVCAAFAIAGCATGYYKSGFTGGFTDKKINDNSYLVAFHGNGYASQDRVHVFWLYRCAELTIEKGYDLLVIRPPPPKGALPEAEPRARPVGYGVLRDDAPTRPRGSASNAMWYRDEPGVLSPAYYFTVTTYSSRGIVVMYRTPLPREVPLAIDAHKLKAMLDEYVKSNGKTAQPDMDIVGQSVMVSHGGVTFSAAADVKVTDSNGQGEYAREQLRTSASIVDTFENYRARFHALFDARREMMNLGAGGEIEFSFSVTRAGEVLDVKVVSTTFGDKVFVDAVSKMVELMHFGRKDLPLTRVPSFKVTFAAYAETV
jgi:hypothetical protein